MSMPTLEHVRIDCERCGTRLKAPKGWVGHIARCPRCHGTVAVGPTFVPPADASIDLAVDDRAGRRWLVGSLLITALAIIVSVTWVLRPGWLRVSGYGLRAPGVGADDGELGFADLREQNERLAARVAEIEKVRARETFFVVDYEVRGGVSVKQIEQIAAGTLIRMGGHRETWLAPVALREVTIGPEGSPVNHGRYRFGYDWMKGERLPQIEGHYELGLRHGEWVGRYHYPDGDREVWRATYDAGKLTDAGGMAYELIEDNIRRLCGVIRGELKEP
jgi:hypothetical protein